jgi:hypothetical protein
MVVLRWALRKLRLLGMGRRLLLLRARRARRCLFSIRRVMLLGGVMEECCLVLPLVR